MLYCISFDQKTYISMLKAMNWPLGEFLRAMKVSRRRLMGSCDEPGIV